MENVIKGFVNYALSFKRTSDHNVEKEAERRLTICAECPRLGAMFCKSCGCYLPAKVRSKSDCPENKW